MSMDISALLPLSSLPASTLTLTPITPATALPADFAALLVQASLTQPDERAALFSSQTAPSLPAAVTTQDSDEPLPVEEPAADNLLLPPETLALMASLPAITPPPPHGAAPAGERTRPAASSIQEIPSAPLSLAPAAPRTAVELPATPALADTFQRQAEQVEAPVISTAREQATPQAGMIQSGTAQSGMTPSPASPAPAVLTTALAAPLNSAHWPQDFSRQLVQFSPALRGGEQRVEMHLNPAHLGPLSVSLTLDDQGAQAQFFSAHASVRAAVELAIPQLREALAEQGISLGEAMVGEHRQQPGEQHASQDGHGRARSAVPEQATELTAEPSGAAPLLNTLGVDLYA